MMINIKAIGAYIFGGSATIAHLQCGWDINTILEMTEDMIDMNAYHFVKNYKDKIRVYKPSEWNNKEFLNKLQLNKYDLFFANNPCSGLSTINKNANVDQPINKRFFEVFDLIKVLNPKVYLIENAPTLASIGTPILQKMVNLLGDNYKFTIIRDYAGNHNVCMQRMRTLIVGWRRDVFNNNIPIINMNKQPKLYIKDILTGLNNNSLNMEPDNDCMMPELQPFYNLVAQGESVIRGIIKHYSTICNNIPKKDLPLVIKQKEKLETGKNIWDKSAYRLKENYIAPSMTSMSQFIHPYEDRDLYIREYARIMGYPDDFKFYPKECKIKTVQCLAQGVPVNFIKYISNEIKRCLLNDYKYIEDYNVIFQNHSKEKGYLYSQDDFYNIKSLIHDVNNNYIPLTK